MLPQNIFISASLLRYTICMATEREKDENLMIVAGMKSEEQKKIEYAVACISEFARATGLNTKEAFRYLYNHGGIDFLIDCYDTEHLLSLDDAVDDLKIVTQKSGGMIV
jgi:hypothetical protein